jgi:hypothetical protein
MDKVMIFHHAVGISGGMSALYGGHGLVALGLMMCVTEYSTVPLNRRNMMTKEESKGKLG